MRPGFTFIELLVVMAIFVLISSVIIPTYQTLLSQAQLSVATDQVATLMRSQEQKTVTEQKPYGVTLAAGAASVPYFLCTAADCSTKSVSTYALPNNIQIGQANFAAGDIVFTTSGAPNYSGTLVLTDTSRNKSKNVALKPSGAIVDNTPEY